MTTLFDDLMTVAEEKVENSPTVIEQRNLTMSKWLSQFIFFFAFTSI
jgi:hypothetical protein